MKGVLLMGGSGSRLAPLNLVCNKHLINVGGKPMAQWNIEKLVGVGITELLIITGKEHMGSIVSYFGSGSEFGCQITYKVQDQAGGIAEALKLVKGFPEEGEHFVVILGDNIFEDDLKSFIDELLSHDMAIATTHSDTPERFGVLQERGIVEKPDKPTSNTIVCGIYGFVEHDGFYKTLDGLKYSERGELEVADLISELIWGDKLWDCYFHQLKGFWTDAGSHDTLIKANKLIEERYGK